MAKSMSSSSSRHAVRIIKILNAVRKYVEVYGYMQLNSQCNIPFLLSLLTSLI